MGNDAALAAYADRISPRSHTGSDTIDWGVVAPSIIARVAERLVGSPPTSRKPHEARFRMRESLKVNTQVGSWYDHEAAVGGGLLDLAIHLGVVADRAEAVEWLRREGFLSATGATSAPVASAPVKRTNGTTSNAAGGGKGRVVAAYDYTNEHGTVLYRVLRFEPKAFSQRRPDGRGGWIKNLDGVEPTLYHLPEVIRAVASDPPFIAIAEGEKDVDTLRRLNIPATCNSGGTGKWQSSFSRYFQGADVAIFQDNDPQTRNGKGELLYHIDGRPKLPGQDHAQAIAAGLYGVARRVRVVDLAKSWPECPPKGDVTRWLEAGHTTDELFDLIEATEAWAPAAVSAVSAVSSAEDSDEELTAVNALTVAGLHTQKEDDEAPNDGWPVPDMGILQEGRRKAPAFPVDLLGPFWSDWVTAAAEGANCPIDYVVMPLLAAAATLIGNSRRVSPWQPWKEPCALWFGNVGFSGTNKSPAADPIFDNIRALEAELVPDFGDQYRAWQTEAEVARAAHDAWKGKVKEAAAANKAAPEMPGDAVVPEEPVRPRLVVSDTTMEKLALLLSAHKKGLMMHRDELYGWLGSFNRYGGGGGERQFWIEAFGGRKFTVDRVKHKTPIVIPYLTISIFGGIQPERLVELLQGAEDGLPSRFLWSWPEPVPPRRPQSGFDSRTAFAALHRLHKLQMEKVGDAWEIEDTDAGEEKVKNPPLDSSSYYKILFLSDDAAATFQTWREAHRIETLALSGAIAAAWAKQPGQVLRLALVIEFLKWVGRPESPEPDCISNATILAAAAIVDEYFAVMSMRVYGDAALPEADRLVATLARWIMKEKPKKLNASAFRREVRLPGLIEAEKVKVAFEGLVEAGWMKPDPSRQGSTPGRKSTDFAINPHLWEVRHG